jgi:hypothetical protein
LRWRFEIIEAADDDEAVNAALKFVDGHVEV